ncbi:hypothetical protein JCM3770_002396 [Rhodotorula araucariae]
MIRTFSAASLADAVITSSPTSSLSRTSTPEDLKPTIKREDSPHPAKKAKVRTLCGNEADNLKAAQDAHNKSRSSHAKAFEAPLLATDPSRTAGGLRKLFHPLIVRLLCENMPRRLSHAQSKMYKLMRPVIKARLDDLPGRIYIAVDAWTAPNGMEVAGFVLFGRDRKNQLVELPLDFVQLTESHTAEYLAKTVFRLVTEYSLKDRLAGVCSDNASAMAKSMELLGEKDLAFFEGIPYWIRCFAHILGLVTKSLRNPARIEEADCCLAEDLVALLKPIPNLSAAVLEAKVVQIGNIIRWIDLLSAAFDKILHSPVEYPAVLHNAPVRGFKLLQKYYTYTDDSKFYRLGLLLHPSLRVGYLCAMEWEDDWVKQVRELAIKEFAPYKAAHDASGVERHPLLWPMFGEMGKTVDIKVKYVHEQVEGEEFIDLKCWEGAD